MALDPHRVRQLEQQLNRIANVEAASIRLDPAGHVESVDVIADRSRSPQRIVRDVEIVLREGRVDIDHRKIGVAALDAPADLVRKARGEVRSAPPAPESGAQSAGETRDADHPSTSTPLDSPQQPEVSRTNPRADRPSEDSTMDMHETGARMAVIELEPDSERIRLSAVHSTTRDGAFSVEVELSVGAFEGLPGRAEGPAHEPAGCAVLVAHATLDAVRNLLQPGYEAQLRELRIIDMGGSPFVAVTVDFGRGRQLKRVAGACLQHGSLYDSAVYATLDAINRPLGRAHFRQIAVLGEDRAQRDHRAGA